MGLQSMGSNLIKSGINTLAKETAPKAVREIQLKTMAQVEQDTLKLSSKVAKKVESEFGAGVVAGSFHEKVLKAEVAILDGGDKFFKSLPGIGSMYRNFVEACDTLLTNSSLQRHGDLGFSRSQAKGAWGTWMHL